MTDSKLTHIDDRGRARMVDVGEKAITQRSATARARVKMSAQALRLVVEGSKKGDVLQVARIAGLQAAKKTSDLIPLCHPLALDGAEVELSVDETASSVEVLATVRCTGKTGVEMEALTAASVASLTVYDMVKAVDKGVVIEEVLLLSKSGGRSGLYERGDG